MGDVRTFGGADYAFLYDSGTTTNLNAMVDPSCGWNPIQATGINDSGCIVGYGTNSAGQTHAFLLTPFPEPLHLCSRHRCLGLLAAAWRRREGG